MHQERSSSINGILREVAKAEDAIKFEEKNTNQYLGHA